MSFVLDNQLLLLLLCFTAGCAAVLPMLLRPAAPRAWHYADLLWVLLGGIGTLAALLAGAHVEDSGRLERQIDIAYATTGSFDRDAARFRLSHCEAPHADPALRAPVRRLCDKVEFLSASTAENSELPLFLGVTRQAMPPAGLSLFRGGGGAAMRGPVAEAAMRFDPATLLVFAALDDPARAALDRLAHADAAPGIAAEFRVLAGTYDALIAQVEGLYGEWLLLQRNAGILTLQVIALCLVAFAAPFRLGRSLVALIRPPAGPSR